MKRIVKASSKSLAFRLCIFVVAMNVCAGPRLVCDAPMYDFGKVLGGNEIVHEFILKNKGDETVVISNIKNCCGTQSTVAPIEILPGSNAVCKTVFTTRNRYGSQNKQILISSNNRENPYFELRITGTLLQALEVSPRYLRLDDLSPDGSIDQTIVATNMLDQPVVLESVESTVHGIEAEVVESNERSWVVRLKREGSLKTGKFSGQIRLVFSSGTANVEIIGIVKPAIQAVPDRVVLTGAADEPVERLVMLRGVIPFSVASAILEDAEGTVETKQLAEGKWLLTLSVRPRSVGNRSTLAVETRGAHASTIKIPLCLKKMLQPHFREIND